MRKAILLFIVSMIAISGVFGRKSGLHKFRSDAKNFLNIGVGPNYMFGDLG